MEKKAHHLWQAETDENGKVIVNRNNAERDEFSDEDFAKSVSASAWGIWGASLVDEITASKATMPKAIQDRFKVVASELKKSGEKAPRVLSWDELSKAFGKEVIAETRAFVAHGMKVRQASKFLNLPFIVTADLLEDSEVIGKEALKAVVGLVKSGKADEALESYGRVASKVSALCEEASQGLCKMAIDESAKAYWETYYGEFGKQLVSEVKKRIRADAAYEWLLKCGVDQAAADYWQNYFSEMGYGEAMTKDVPKRLSPSKKDKKND